MVDNKSCVEAPMVVVFQKERFVSTESSPHSFTHNLQHFPLDDSGENLTQLDEGQHQEYSGVAERE